MRPKLIQDRKYQNLPRYKYSFDQKIYNLNNSSIQQPHSRSHSFDSNSLFPDSIKSKPRFSIGRNSSSMIDNINFNEKTPFNLKKKDYLKLPSLQKNFTANPQEEVNMPIPDSYYQAKLLKAIKTKENTYLSNLARQHFTQTIQALKIGKQMKTQIPKTQIRLSKRNPKFKTIYLDMDQTLIHCDENSTKDALVLDFPVDQGGTISAGVRIRPYCQQFIQQLSSICEVIIFTASSASYADVILDHLDPHKKYFSHRLYRQHCTLTKGFFVKDLRVVNRKLEQCLIVDNSAFSFMLQPNNGVPIIPFYHYAKDKQLLSLLQFLKKALIEPDMRTIVKQTFFWQKLLKSQQSPQKLFLKHFGIQ